MVVSPGLLLVLAATTASGSVGPPAPEQTVPSAAAATKPVRPPLSQRWSNGWRNLGADARYLVTAPARPTRRGIVITSAVVGGTVLLILLDDEIREEVQEARNDTLDDWEKRIEPLGKGEVDALGSALVYLGGRLAGSEEVSETGRALLESLLFTQAFTTAFKGAFGRDPPGADARASDFFDDGTVFPSGHTSRAFAVATVLAERHGKTAAWIAYPLATLVGLFRIESDAHWASDVLAGAALGHGIARAVVRRRDERAARRGPRVGLAPTVSPDHGGAGMMLRIEF